MALTMLLIVHAAKSPGRLLIVHAGERPRLIRRTLAMGSRRNRSRCGRLLEQQECLNGVPLGLGHGLQASLRPGSNGHGGYTEFQETRIRNFIGRRNLDFLQNLGEYANKQEDA